MEKKNLKWYEAPQVEIVEMETAASLLVVSQENGVDTEHGDMNKD